LSNCKKKKQLKKTKKQMNPQQSVDKRECLIVSFISLRDRLHFVCFVLVLLFCWFCIGFVFGLGFWFMLYFCFCFCFCFCFVFVFVCFFVFVFCFLFFLFCFVFVFVLFCIFIVFCLFFVCFFFLLLLLIAVCIPLWNIDSSNTIVFTPGAKTT